MSRSREQSGRWSDQVESSDAMSLSVGGGSANKAKDFSHNIVGGSRLSARRLAGLAEELSERDRALLAVLARLRVASGAQLERLSFREIVASARGRVRRRVLGRLVRLGLVVTLDRRVGGVRAGSAGLVYALSGAGWRLVDLLDRRSEAPRRRTRETPGALFLAHALAVSEIYVDLKEQVEQFGAMTDESGPAIEIFDVEADARWRDESGEVHRPDALVVLSLGPVEDVWWLEVDRGTESLARVQWMLRRYQQFATAAGGGPRGVIPRVLVTVLDDKRRRGVDRLISRMTASEGLLQVVRQDEATGYLVRELVEPDGPSAHERAPPGR